MFLIGVIAIWLLSLSVALFGLAVIIKKRLWLTKAKSVVGMNAVVIGWITLLLGLYMTLSTWPPLLLH